MAGPSAASVVVLFRRGGRGLEVFWVRRGDHLAFLGGFWAFPGGRVDDRDRTTEVAGAEGDAAARIAAAVREVREETGVELPLDAGKFLDAGLITTPAWAAIRFAATYYFVEIPDGQTPDTALSGGELAAGEWIHPAEALAIWRRGERCVPPMVVRTLQVLESARAAPLGAAAETLRATFAADERGPRIWDLVPGIALCPVRTPTLPPATHTNCYIVGGAELVVIDPASPYPEERAALDEALDSRAAVGRRVREIWLTHHHVDHVSGAAHLAARLGVPIAAHRITARLVSATIQVDRILEDGDATTLAGIDDVPERRLRAVFTPGHAPGHLCYLEETTGFLVAGDMVAGVGTILVEPTEGDMIEYLASLARMRGLGARALLPAHGPTLTSPTAKLDEYTRHRLWREARVTKALGARSDASAGELVPDVYQDVGPAVFPIAERSLVAHLVKLVKEGRVRELGGGRYAMV